MPAQRVTFYFSGWIAIRNGDEKNYLGDSAFGALAVKSQVFTCKGAQIQVNNPFEDKDGEFFALINEQGQYSLWPSFIDIPAGWTPVHPRANRDVCLEYINAHWLDMRPKSLAEAIKDTSKNR